MGLSTRSLTVVLENTGSMSRTDVLEWTINIPFVSPMAFSASGDLVQFTFTAHDNTPPLPKKKRMFRSRATPKLRGIEAAPRPSNPCSSTWAKWRVGVCGVASVVDLALVGWLWGFVISTTPERKKGHLVQQQQQQHHHIYSVCPDHGIEGVHLQAGRFRGSPNVFQSKGLDKR